MRSRVVAQREIREKYGVEVKSFVPDFVIPRRFPGWDAPAPDRIADLDRAPTADRPVVLEGKRPVYIEVKPRA